MFAVFEDGSRQYRVQEGDVVELDFRDADPGARLEFGRVLLYQNADDLRLGQPVVEGARVLGEVVEQTSIKLYIQHFRRRKNYRRLRGHRQHYTRIQIRNILLAGQEPPVAPPPPAPAPAETPAAATPPAQPSATPPPAPAETPAAATPPAQPSATPPSAPAETPVSATPPAQPSATPPPAQPSVPEINLPPGGAPTA